MNKSINDETNISKYTELTALTGMYKIGKEKQQQIINFTMHTILIRETNIA